MQQGHRRPRTLPDNHYWVFSKRGRRSSRLRRFSSCVLSSPARLDCRSQRQSSKGGPHAYCWEQVRSRRRPGNWSARRRMRTSARAMYANACACCVHVHVQKCPHPVSPFYVHAGGQNGGGRSIRAEVRIQFFRNVCKGIHQR